MTDPQEALTLDMLNGEIRILQGKLAYREAHTRRIRPALEGLQRQITSLLHGLDHDRERQGDWYCPRCNDFLDWRQVTCDETHEACGCGVVYVYADSLFGELVHTKVLLREAERKADEQGDALALTEVAVKDLHEEADAWKLALTRLESFLGKLLTERAERQQLWRAYREAWCKAYPDKIEFGWYEGIGFEEVAAWRRLVGAMEGSSVTAYEDPFTPRVHRGASQCQQATEVSNGPSDSVS